MSCACSYQYLQSRIYQIVGFGFSYTQDFYLFFIIVSSCHLHLIIFGGSWMFFISVCYVFSSAVVILVCRMVMYLVEFIFVCPFIYRLSQIFVIIIVIWRTIMLRKSFLLVIILLFTLFCSFTLHSCYFSFRVDLISCFFVIDFSLSIESDN